MVKKLLQLFSLVPVLILAGSTSAIAFDLNDGAEAVMTDSSKVYDVVDKMPEIQGGIKEVYKNIRYPQGAIASRVEGRVFVKFIVDEQGNVKSPQIIKDIGAGCGKAAIDAIKKAKFSPGTLQGQPVKVYYTLPVTFKINN